MAQGHAQSSSVCAGRMDDAARFARALWSRSGRNSSRSAASLEQETHTDTAAIAIIPQDVEEGPCAEERSKEIEKRNHFGNKQSKPGTNTGAHTRGIAGACAGT